MSAADIEISAGWVTDIFGNGSVAHYRKRVNFDTTSPYACCRQRMPAGWAAGITRSASAV